MEQCRFNVQSLQDWPPHRFFNDNDGYELWHLSALWLPMNLQARDLVSLLVFGYSTSMNGRLLEVAHVDCDTITYEK
jgi:hypothetical protein